MLARTLHVGVLADCFFDPSTALCLKQAAQPEASAPLVSLCQPTRCPNACVTARHRPAWAKAAGEAQALLREKRLSGPQRTALEGDLARFEGVLRRNWPGLASILFTLRSEWCWRSRCAQVGCGARGRSW